MDEDLKFYYKLHFLWAYVHLSFNIEIWIIKGQRYFIGMFCLSVYLIKTQVGIRFFWQIVFINRPYPKLRTFLYLLLLGISVKTREYDRCKIIVINYKTTIKYELTNWRTIKHPSTATGIREICLDHKLYVIDIYNCSCYFNFSPYL